MPPNFDGDNYFVFVGLRMMHCTPIGRTADATLPS
jgi:hypothetical protein